MLRLQHHFITRLRRPRQHHRPVNRMLQLAHVARPRPLQPARVASLKTTCASPIRRRHCSQK
jgi:hypothetical protein